LLIVSVNVVTQWKSAFNVYSLALSQCFGSILLRRKEIACTLLLICFFLPELPNFGVIVVSDKIVSPYEKRKVCGKCASLLFLTKLFLSMRKKENFAENVCVVVVSHKIVSLYSIRERKVCRKCASLLFLTKLFLSRRKEKFATNVRHCCFSQDCFSL
jgi:ribosomal protein S27AE